MNVKLLQRAFLCSGIAVLIAAMALPAWCGGCVGCGGAGSLDGINVNIREGTVDVLPVVAGVDTGPAAPGMCNASNLPGSGNARNFGDATAPKIKWGTSRITLDGSNVMLDGIKQALWSWNSTSRTLTTPDGRKYIFDGTTGMLTSQSGPDGLFVTTFQYDTTYPDRVASATDYLGNTWTYGVDISKPGPDYVINPDGTHKVEYTYVAPGYDGAGQYNQITVYKKDSQGAWITQQTTGYSYNSDNKITQVTITDPDDAMNPVRISITYYSADQNGRTKPVQRVYNQKYSSDDTVYSYPSDETIDNYAYGVSEVRLRETYGTDTDSKDMVTRYYYYKTSEGKNADLFREVKRTYNGSSWTNYATTEYQVYGYLSRFSATPPTYYDVLQGKPWKTIDPMGNATTYTYSTANGQVTRTDLPTNDYSQYWYKQINSADSVYVEKVRDFRGKYTRYTRDITNYPNLVTKIEVSDNDSNYITVKEMSYWMPGIEGYDSRKQGMLYQLTVPDIEGTDDMVTTYDYSETINQATYYRPEPTTIGYSWYNVATASYESKSITTSYYMDRRTRWIKDALNKETGYIYNDESKLTNTWLPTDSSDCGTISGSTTTTVSDSSKSWFTNQLAGMALIITSGSAAGTYTIASNTANQVAVTSGNLSAAYPGTYEIRSFTETAYLPCCGSVEWEKNERGKKAYYTYQSGRASEIRNDVTGETSNNPVVEYMYNDLGQVTEEHVYASDQANPRVTHYTYDQLGRVIEVVYPHDGGTQLLWNEYRQYDVNNNIVAVLKGVVDNGSIVEGHVTVYEYDSLSRVTKVKYDYSASTWPVSPITFTSPYVSYSYDGGSGLATEITDGTISANYSYDTLGSVVSYTPPLPADYGIEYTYNAAGQKTSVLVKENGNNKYHTLYGFFKNGWLKQVKGQEWISNSWTDRVQVDYEYDSIGRRVSRKNNGTTDVTTAYVYDARDMIKSITHSKSGDLYRLQYTRDAGGNPLEIYLSGSAFSQPYTNADRVRFSYDALGELTGQDWGYVSGTNWVSMNNTSWTYDWVGNRGSSYDYNQVDEYLADNGYVYDKLGNLEYVPNSTSSTRTRYYYNGDNLLTQVDDITPGNTSSTFVTWDYEWNRIRLVCGPDTWQFLYDRSAGSPAVILSIEDVDSINSHTFYVREPSGKLLASFDQADPHNISYYHFDGSGSTVLVTDGSGTVLSTSTYDAWGAVFSAPPTGSQPYQYVGQSGYFAHTSTQSITLADMLQLGVRLYNPELGRFTQRDRFRQIGWSAYLYANASPDRYRDAWGLEPEFQGCNFAQQTALKAALYIIKQSLFLLSGRGTPDPEAFKECMRQRVNDVVITCKQNAKDDPACPPRAYGATPVVPGTVRDVIMCQHAFDNGCYESTLVHEMAHSCTPGRSRTEGPEGKNAENDMFPCRPYQCR